MAHKQPELDKVEQEGWFELASQRPDKCDKIYHIAPHHALNKARRSAATFGVIFYFFYAQVTGEGIIMCEFQNVSLIWSWDNNLIYHTPVICYRGTRWGPFTHQQTITKKITQQQGLNFLYVYCSLKQREQSDIIAE